MRLGQDCCLIYHRLNPEELYYFHVSYPWIYIGENEMRIQFLIRKQCIHEVYCGGVWFFFP